LCHQVLLIPFKDKLLIGQNYTVRASEPVVLNFCTEFGTIKWYYAVNGTLLNPVYLGKGKLYKLTKVLEPKHEGFYFSVIQRRYEKVIYMAKLTVQGEHITVKNGLLCYTKLGVVEKGPSQHSCVRAFILFAKFKIS